MNVRQALRDLFYSPKCPFCGRVLNRGEEGFCALCQETLPWTGERDGKAVDNCDICLSPLWYRDGVREGVRRFKFRGVREHARPLGLLMAQCLGDRWHEPVDLITWVPLSKQRLKERGYDQAELLARRVAELAGMPAESTLEKLRQNRTQSDLADDGERRANAAGAYRVLPGTDLAGKRVVLVDDIATSGATLAECAAQLRNAGAATVVALTMARAR